ncbi:MAG: PIN domain-containing protein [Deltaproteobacteria bacterium]|nr:PIN domain-containing protein [Deltaproteobacteria bacterium]
MSEQEQYFLDSSFLVALLDFKDVHHPRAVEMNTLMKRQKGELFISDIVLNETLSVIARKYEGEARHEELKRKFQAFFHHIEAKPILCLYELVNQSFGFIQKMILHTNGKLGFHDCLIVFFLRQVPLVHLVTFDEDFRQVKGISVL